MKHRVVIVFGKDASNKVLLDVPLTFDERKQYEKEYFFITKDEKEAFCKGIEEAVGWMDYYIQKNS